MNTAEISHALRHNPVTAAIFRGVHSADQLTLPLQPLPGACVVNTEPSDKPGEHWIALYQETPDVMETWDSFGMKPSFYSPFFSKMGRLVLQTDQIQHSDSSACGQYCLFFILRRASGESYSNIIHLFTQSKASNDAMVTQYVNHHFDLDTKVIDSEFLNQLSKPYTKMK